MVFFEGAYSLISQERKEHRNKSERGEKEKRNGGKCYFRGGIQ
jgi:hypothetical protein